MRSNRNRTEQKQVLSINGKGKNPEIKQMSNILVQREVIMFNKICVSNILTHDRQKEESDGNVYTSK